MTDLDALVRRAREVGVRRDHAEAYVGELDRWAARPAERSWWPWLAGGVGIAAAAAAIALVLLRDPQAAAPAAATAVRIGDRVALVAEPGTDYRVIAADRHATRIAVDRGAVTARLWSGDGHRLTLEGGGVVALATGTVYRLAVGPGGATVHVDEGTVDVRRAGESHAIAAGRTYPPDAAPVEPTAARTLLALSASPPMPEPEPVDAAIAAAVIVEDAPPPPDAAVAPPARPVDAAPPPDAGPDTVDRWRRARQLRGRGEFAAAVAECIAIADARDATWSPIALVEAARIQLDSLAAPERAVELADRALADWPTSALATEARELRCRALRQLGRACAP